jgi:hypothetical protein
LPLGYRLLRRRRCFGERRKKKTEPISSRSILLYYAIWWKGKIGKIKVGRKRTLGRLKAYLRQPRTIPVAILSVEIMRFGGRAKSVK